MEKHALQNAVRFLSKDFRGWKGYWVPRAGTSLGSVFTITHLHLVLMLSKPEEWVLHVPMAVQLLSHYRCDCRNLGCSLYCGWANTWWCLIIPTLTCPECVTELTAIWWSSDRAFCVIPSQQVSSTTALCRGSSLADLLCPLSNGHVWFFQLNRS